MTPALELLLVQRAADFAVYGGAAKDQEVIMQVNNSAGHGAAPVSSNQTKGAVVERSVNVDENGMRTFSKSMDLPNGKTMTSQRTFSRDGHGFSLHFEKLLPNGRQIVIDVTKTNGVDDGDDASDETQPIGGSDQADSGTQPAPIGDDEPAPVIGDPAAGDAASAS